MTRDSEWFATIRHLGGHGGGPHAGDGRHFGGPMFGGPRGRGRRRRGDVRAALLLLLAENAGNGYQLMQAIEDRTGGRWRPSPGAVYPALAQLEDEGLIRPVQRDGVKLFEITDAGREHLAERAGDVAPWDAVHDPGDEAAFDVRKLIGEVAAAAMQVARAGDERQMARAGETLKDTRRALYRILAEETDD